MTYRDRQEPGSYRGIPFHWTDSELQLGRRTAVYEIPGSELGVGYIDNGRRAWRQQLTVFTIGPDYDLDRDDLIKAFEDPTPAILVHPKYGRKRVVIDGAVSITESDATGGKAVFSFTAVEVATQPTPTQRTDTAGQLRTAADNAIVAIGSDFEDNHSVAGENFLRADALDKMNDAVASVRSATAKVRTVINGPSLVASELDALTSELTYLINSPRLMAQALLGLGASIRDDLRQIGNAFGTYTHTARASDDIGVAILPLDEADTPTRRQQATNARATKFAAKGLMLANIARTAPDVSFSDSDDAKDARDALITSIDSLIEAQEAGETTLEAAVLDPDPEVFQTLRQLQAAVYTHLTAVAGGAIELAEYEPAEPLPSVVIAQQLYGDATRFEEIEARNSRRINHPGFIYTTIEVAPE